MRILVCGGRDFGDIDRDLQHHEPDCWEVRRSEKEYAFVWNTLQEIVNPDDEIISGCARGPDSIALQFASAYGNVALEFPADWDRYGKAAGYVRNARMLSEGKPDLVVAFPGGKGTRMMVELARKAGVRVVEYEDLI